MPNRLLKEGIVDSELINALSPEAEVCFYRLLVVSDDLGRMDARTAIVRSRCFPLKEQSNINAKIEIWLEELVGAGLIVRYAVEGRPYLQIKKWDQRVRSAGKYPAPEEADAPTNDSNLLSNDGQASDDGQQDAARVGARNARVGLGLGKGLGAPKPNDVRFDAASGSWSVPDLLQSQWAKAYPAVDVASELAKAAVWLTANPKNQKSNYARFLSNWLSKAQDRAPRVGGGQKQESFV